MGRIPSGLSPKTGAFCCLSRWRELFRRPIGRLASLVWPRTTLETGYSECRDVAVDMEGKDERVGRESWPSTGFWPRHGAVNGRKPLLGGKVHYPEISSSSASVKTDFI